MADIIINSTVFLIFIFLYFLDYKQEILDKTCETHVKRMRFINRSFIYYLAWTLPGCIADYFRKGTFIRPLSYETNSFDELVLYFATLFFFNFVEMALFTWLSRFLTPSVTESFVRLRKILFFLAILCFCVSLSLHNFGIDFVI